MKLFNHIKNLIMLNFKLIRNSTITTKLNSGYENLTFELLDFITDDGPNYYKRIGIGPFNNQNLRKKLIQELLVDFKPDFILETGTFLGDSTEFFGKYSKVVSIEKSKLFYYLSKSRFYKDDHIEIVYGESSVELKKFENFNKKTFFYLDAHWGEDMPLKIEIEQITNNYSDYIICIDDFSVPKNSSWGFDSYDGVNLDIKLLQNLNAVKIYFPDYSSDLETGGKRGAVFLTNTHIDNEAFKTNNFKLYSE